MALSKAQVKEAIDQMVISCNLKMSTYEMASARGTLYELGYHGEDAEQVLQALFDGGFTYCLDPAYHKGSETVISADVCYFGPDQLADRLLSVHLA